ncbi:lipoyl(octanoyl) transferase LipB [Thorsellia kenyensis]|uniref:Octanoyltransferase n=1 Tax=Thorsellia kenyensis TaxID=1549888 RepID=A0ABV6CDB5_9GAMM
MKNYALNSEIIIKHLGLISYASSYKAMHDFTHNRNATTLDEIWVLEHPEIFTQGRAGKEEHILKTSSIPIFQSDRGGQVTFHGPGQLIIYPLINLKRYGLNIREFVTLLETSVINTLAKFSIEAYARKDAPGVYVDEISCLFSKNISNKTVGDSSLSNPGIVIDQSLDRFSSSSSEKKICSLGLKVSKGCTLHGLALNIDIDLTPFDYINPCGLLGMQMTSVANITKNIPDKQAITNTLINELLRALQSPLC